MTYDDLVAQTHAHGQPDPVDDAAQVVAAAERIETQWRALGWNGQAADPEVPFAGELTAAVPAPVFAALVARHLAEDGHGDAEKLVMANREFVLEARAVGASPRAAADLAHSQLSEVGTRPRAVSGRERKKPRASETARGRVRSF